MPAMWWLEVERKRLAKEGDLAGAALIAFEQLEMIKQVGHRPTSGDQCPTCGYHVGEGREESDEEGDEATPPDYSDPRSRRALKVLQGGIFNDV